MAVNFLSENGIGANASKAAEERANRTRRRRFSAALGSSKRHARPGRAQSVAPACGAFLGGRSFHVEFGGGFALDEGAHQRCRFFCA
eukprot:11774318-Heterocapsa_arctica.AAC.1